MELENYDIVYFIKESETNEELKYSIRSVVENLPHRKIVFVGGCPKDLTPDLYIPTIQDKETKWENTNVAMRTACEAGNGISDRFILMNDDFFVMSYVKELPMYYDGSLPQRVADLNRYTNTNYKDKLKGCMTMLGNRYLPLENYAVHIPMPISKINMKIAFRAFPNGLMWRSLYGNLIDGHFPFKREIKDVKIFSIMQKPTGNEIFLSTTDASFERGAVGEHIKKRFPNPSEYENR